MMACVESISNSPINDDSQREEGEIIDDLDDLSDISSEEECLLRRLQILEKVNNALERKAKNSISKTAGNNRQKDESLPDLSDISATELDEISVPFDYGTTKDKTLKSHYKHKRKKETEVTGKCRGHKRKSQRYKKKSGKKTVSDSSDDSDETKIKKRKLADAVNVNKQSTTTLKTRLKNMLCTSKRRECLEPHRKCSNNKLSNISSINSSGPRSNSKAQENDLSKGIIDKFATELCNNDQLNENRECKLETAKIDQNREVEQIHSSEDSDDDLELLRQNALQTKAKHSQVDVTSEVISNEVLNKDDIDIYELRMICLRSTALKHAIERKREEKLIKRISLSQPIQDSFIPQGILNSIHSEDNTDIESVDMDIGSDGEEKIKGTCNNEHIGTSQIHKCNMHIPNLTLMDDEIEEDEDVLRAKLLTSLSKNLPTLIDPNKIVKNVSTQNVEHTGQTFNNVPDEKKFIINICESDSEGEHEATKNLTKMHMKLSEQQDFQQKLDIFLKSTRSEVEKKQSTGSEETPIPTLSKPDKFVPKALNHLPKSEHIEYQNLVKRMAELEKIKQVRQVSLNHLNTQNDMKETLKPRNVSVDLNVGKGNLEQQIAQSRKKIAEESARMLKLKELGIKLIQKYKIVQTELKNISTAITLNKKEQKTAQIRLAKIRTQHQTLLKGSINKHSNINKHLANVNVINLKTSSSRLQKENNPSNEDHNPQTLKNLKVTVVNDLKLDCVAPGSRLSMQVDVNSNKKTARVPPAAGLRVTDDADSDSRAEPAGAEHERVHPCESSKLNVKETTQENDNGDYESPLQAFARNATWAEDPNGVLCPFEVGGNCKDLDCKFLHPKTATAQ